MKNIPPRFEDEYPNEATVLMDICKKRGKAKTQGKRLKPFSLDVLSPIKSIGRNDPCPCGSGKKFKKCCINA
jgi:uncharacterized protein YecA (UPF0149 family)